MTRTTIRSALAACHRVHAGARRARARSRTSTPTARSRRVSGQTQTMPGGPIASQEAIKEIGENGGGPYNANSSHPYENPNPITNILEIWLLLAIPFGVHVDVREDGRRREAGHRLALGDGRVVARDVARRDAVRVERQPAPDRRRCEPEGDGDAAGREHGGQGGPLRPPALRTSSRRRRPEPRPARSTRCTTATRRSAALRRS